MAAEPISILLFSDTHIGFDHAPSNKVSKHRRRGPDFFQNFKSIVDQIIERKVDYAIHCGDVFEKQNVPAFLVDQTYAEFIRIANAGIRLFIVPGNHERSVLPPSLFLNHPNIYVFTEATTHVLPGLSISGFPYYKGDIRSLFPSFKKKMQSGLSINNFNILCLHHAIDGVKAGHHFFEFKNRKDTLNISDLPGQYDLILCGHIHKHQQFNCANSNGKSIPIIYSGSTERTMFDEIDEVKGYHTFEIDGKDWTHQFHPIDTRPMYQISISPEQSVDDLSNFLNEAMNSIPKDAVIQISAKDELHLYQLSRLKTEGFFASTMNITLSGFSSLHRQKAD